MNSAASLWQFECSVECHAPRSFAWRYWTNIANWNDPPATFHIDGPFAAGSKITTTLPGQTLHSVIRYVLPDSEAIIDLQLPETILTFHWALESLSDVRTRITQHLELSGANAPSLVAQARMMEQTTPAGMKKLAAAIEEAHTKNAGD